MYSKESIDKVKDLEIWPAISKYIELKQAGANYKGKSPFKEENTPSFVVSPAKNMYKCFATGKGGDLLDFYMSDNKCGFIEAIEVLAADNSIYLEKVKLPKVEQARIAKKEEFYNLAKAVQLKFSKQLHALESGNWAKEHLDKLKYSQDVLLEWQLGYADNSGVISHMAKEKALLGPAKEIGIVGTGKNNHTYDSFRDRIMFPVHNHKGTVIGFGGRRQNGDDQKSAKYLNSKESDIYLKKHTLYGLHFAKHAMRKKNFGILVEGYTDVITMHNHGADTTVGSCGTAFTNEQAKLLKQFCQTVYIMRDGDAAGEMAIEKDLKKLLAYGFNVHVHVLAEKEDPDTYARNFTDVEQQVLNHSEDALIWKFKRIAESFISTSYLSKVDEINTILALDIQPLEEDIRTPEQLKEMEADVIAETNKHNQSVEDLIADLETKATKEIEDLDSDNKEYKNEVKKINSSLKTKMETEKLSLKNLKKEVATARAHSTDWNKQLSEQIAELKNQAKTKQAGLTKIDAHALEVGKAEACDLLFSIKAETTRNFYTDQAAAILNMKGAVLKREVAKKQKAALDLKSKEKPNAKTLGLPIGCSDDDVEFFLEHRFLEHQNQYWFSLKEGVLPCSNHLIIPLYFIDGKEENKRLCEVVNIHGYRKIVDFDSEKMISLVRLKEQLVRAGNFSFTNVGTLEFDLLLQRILGGFDRAVPLISLGQHPKGFYAMSNGIIKKDFSFVPSNKYGVIHVPNDDEPTKEENDEFLAYEQVDDFYYTPAFSVMHRKNQKGDDPYESDRFFVFKESQIALTEWMNSMVFHYENKGKIGVVFNLASLFRDLFLKHYRSFPLLACIGEKGSGKSDFGQILSNFFYYAQKPIFLTSTSQVAINTRLSKAKNTVVFFDEYKENGVLDSIKDTLVSTYVGKGREVGTLKRGQNKSLYIESSVVYSGQFRPTYQDNALAERSISLNFPKQKYSQEAKELFEEFNGVTAKGMSSLIVDIFKHREFFEENLKNTHNEVAVDLKNSFDASGVSDRIIKNYLSLLVTYKILAQKINFPFDYQDFKNICVLGIQQNSEAIQDSDTTTEFWDSVQYLFAKRMIREGYQFKIDNPTAIKVLVNSKETTTWQNESRKELLFLRMNMVHAEYSQYCQKTQKVILAKGTLSDYLKNKPYYIGVMKSKRFKDGSSSCFVFDYSLMSSEDYMILSLNQAEHDPNLDDEDGNDSPTNEQSQLNLTNEEKDDLPF